MTDELRDLFERAAPPPASPARTSRTLEEVRPTFRRARRRHRIRTGMAAAAVSVLVAGGAVALLNTSSSTDVRTDPADPAPSGVTDPVPADEPAPEEAGPPDDRTATDLDDAPGPGTDDGTPTTPTGDPEAAADPPAAGDGTDDRPVVPPATSAPAPSSTTVAPATTIAPSPVTETATTPGGSVTVRHDGIVITVESIDPAPGFTPDLAEDDPTEVKVYFRSGSAEYEIESHLESGQLVVDADT